MSTKQLKAHMERKWQRSLRAGGFSSASPWKNKYKRTAEYWKRPDKVRDPKTAFRYLMDNYMGQNSGKLLNDFASRGEYYWVERDRGADQSYYIVRKRGNYVVVLQRKWVVDGQGVNTFLGGLTGYKSEPVRVDKIILRHPIMQVDTFQQAYKDAAPDLGVWLDDHFDNMTDD
jgi:hypothetical protein